MTRLRKPEVVLQPSTCMVYNADPHDLPFWESNIFFISKFQWNLLNVCRAFCKIVIIRGVKANPAALHSSFNNFL